MTSAPFGEVNKATALSSYSSMGFAETRRPSRDVPSSIQTSHRGSFSQGRVSRRASFPNVAWATGLAPRPTDKEDAQQVGEAAERSASEGTIVGLDKLKRRSRSAGDLRKFLADELGGKWQSQSDIHSPRSNCDVPLSPRSPPMATGFTPLAPEIQEPQGKNPLKAHPVICAPLSPLRHATTSVDPAEPAVAAGRHPRVREASLVAGNLIPLHHRCPGGAPVRSSRHLRAIRRIRARRRAQVPWTQGSRHYFLRPASPIALCVTPGHQPLRIQCTLL